MNSQQSIDVLSDAHWHDLTQSLSIFTPPWPGEMPLQVHFFKRLTGSWGGGQGANGELIEWSNNTGTHLVGPRAFHSGARAIAVGSPVLGRTKSPVLALRAAMTPSNGAGSTR